MNQRILSVALATTIAGLVVQAHHSIAMVYDTSRQVTVEGVVTAFRFVNPHPFLLMDVKDASGKTQTWRLEVDNLSELAEIGVTRDTWKAGDWVVVAGSPGRTERHSLYVRRLDRPADGLHYEQVGSSPRIRTPSGECPGNAHSDTQVRDAATADRPHARSRAFSLLFGHTKSSDAHAVRTPP